MPLTEGKLPPDLLDAAVELMGRSGRGGTVRVQGRSMEPTLYAGQLLAVEFSPRSLRRGDMLLFRQQDYLVVHRLVGRARRQSGPGRWRTRGDGVIGFDPPVAPDRVVGRALAVHGDGGWRTLGTRRGRRYAWCLAWHDYFWGTLGSLAGRGDGLSRRLGLPAPWRRGVAALDAAVLGRVHRILFRWVHPRIDCPPEADPASTADEATEARRLL